MFVEIYVYNGNLFQKVSYGLVRKVKKIYLFGVFFVQVNKNLIESIKYFQWVFLVVFGEYRRYDFVFKEIEEDK